MHELVRRLLEDPDRFAREHRLVILKAVHTAARKFRAAETDVEDAVNEVLLELLKDDAKALRATKGDAAFTAFLTVTACRVGCREFARRVPKPEPRSPARPSDPENLAELEEKSVRRFSRGEICLTVFSPTSRRGSAGRSRASR